MIIGALAVAAVLLAATAAGYDSVSGGGPLRPNGDVPGELGRAELCAALIRSDGRQALQRLARGDDAGAAFASRNDQFRADWIIAGLTRADPARDWRTRVEALADKAPTSAADSGYTTASEAYVDCLQGQNADPAFTAALHSYLGYSDPP